MSRDRKDGNHARLRKFARSMGWFWRDMPRKAGFDALMIKGRLKVLAELKLPGEELSLTPNEKKTHAELKTHGVTVEILTCEEDVVALSRPQPQRRWE